MKTLIMLFAEKIEKDFLPDVFSWGHSVPGASKVLVCAANADVRGAAEKEISAVEDALPVIYADAPLLADVLKAVLDNADDAETVLFGRLECPFYDTKLTAETYKLHTDYAAEYSFADGYPFGVVPEFVATGTVRTLLSLCGMKDGFASMPFTNDALFSLLKTDINSFDIETLISPVDYRMLRLDFSYSTKRGLVLCRSLAALKKELAAKLGRIPSAVELCDEASINTGILHTLPSFYAIQVSAACAGTCSYCPYPEACRTKFGTAPSGCKTFMKKEDFARLVDKIAAFSDDAVVSLSLWGESLLHPDIVSLIKTVLSKPSLSILIETDCENLTQPLIDEVAAAVKDASPRTNGKSAIMWICGIDAVSEETYRVLHGENGLTLASVTEKVHALEAAFPGDVYAQMVRVNENEVELEPFFRGWNNRIIQKYDYVSGQLPDRKPADLSPVKRNCCWHLRRDMSILVDGSVPLCRQFMLGSAVGNAFTDDLETIWKASEESLALHIEEKYEGLCRDCDEFYTCNF